MGAVLKVGGVLLLASILSFRASATITETNFGGCLSTTAFGGASNCSQSTTEFMDITVTAGRGAELMVFGGGSATVSSISGGGTWVHGCGAYGSGNNLDLWYNTSTTSASSITVTMSTSGDGRGMLYLEFSGTLGSFALDACNGATSTFSGNSLSGESLTLSATDAVLQGVVTTVLVNSISSGWTCTSSGTTCASNARNGAYDITNSGTAPTWTTASASGATYVIGGIALMETTGGGGTTVLHQLTTLGVGK
jgi:hypothetical protein